MKRLPLLPTLVVALACATMVWLGVWQLQRARWKEGLLASYAAAAGRPVLDGLPFPLPADGAADLGFRRATLTCVPEGRVVQTGGRNRRGQTGYRAIAACRLADPAWLATPARIMLDLGWSAPGVAPAVPAGAVVATGLLIPDPEIAARVGGGALPLLLVAETPAPGLQPSVPPSIADIPNNHRAYAVQWFLFAAVAFTVYVLALRRRAR